MTSRSKTSSAWSDGWPCSKGRAAHGARDPHRGRSIGNDCLELIGPSRFDSRFENPSPARPINLMEGLYLRTEAGGVVTGRAKFVRPEFVEKVKQSEHWQHQAMVPNRLQAGADIWS